MSTEAKKQSISRCTTGVPVVVGGDAAQVFLSDSSIFELSFLFPKEAIRRGNFAFHDPMKCSLELSKNWLIKFSPEVIFERKRECDSEHESAEEEIEVEASVSRTRLAISKIGIDSLSFEIAREVAGGDTIPPLR